MLKKTIPKFKSEAEERAFWAVQDSADYVDGSKAITITMPNLKPPVSPCGGSA